MVPGEAVEVDGVTGVEVADDLAGVGEVGAPEPVAGELRVEAEGADEAVEERGDVEARAEMMGTFEWTSELLLLKKHATFRRQGVN